nr:hypothetical protein [Tanacetum cinerariifolium]
EKRKEKKRKKDKKDKEKKDGKEKKEKDRSEGKRKDKKAKKDKHQDKKKDQEKSKSSTPDEKKIYWQFEGCNGEKLYLNNVPKKKPPVPVKPPVKSPHPDTKYLSQILSVPKQDQWCGDDDQEWLFNRKEGPACKKPPAEDPQVQVWSEAKHIESVDAWVSPYVIPY